MHPGVYVAPSHETVLRARAEGYPARMLPGISSEDCLFADLGEESDLSLQKPKKVRELRRHLRDYLKDVQAPMPRLNPEFGAGAFPDVDQDGLDDDWEFRELLTTAHSGASDPDGDGEDNAAEFAAQTDPLP